jgi:putative flavoprotein involved in K+ transport
MSTSAATRRLSKWLTVFGEALKRGDVESAAGMFAEESYWRDLVAFTWNIKTAEGREAIAAMLESTLASARPESLHLDADASEAGGVTEGWFTFETHVARGHGHIRLKGDKCWTLLTAMSELKGHEEKVGATREKGVEHGSKKGRRTWLERKAAE